jgi:nitrous oxidase accessory protein NosD
LIVENTVMNVGDGCIALNNAATGIVSHNTLRRCNLGIGAGPAGSASTANDSTPFIITANLIEDSDYGVLLGWFGYPGRLGPLNTIVSSNVIRRCRSTAIQNNGAPGLIGGAWIISDNQITHAGFPATQPPRTEGVGPGHGIVAAQLHGVSIRGNQISHGRGDGIRIETVAHSIVSDNIISADGTGPLTTGIAVLAGDDVAVTDNTLRGYGTGISVMGASDRVRVRGNAVDAGEGGGVGIHIAASVDRFLASENTVSGAAGQSRCMPVDGAITPIRVVLNNICW